MKRRKRTAKGRTEGEVGTVEGVEIGGGGGGGGENEHAVGTISEDYSKK